MPLKQCEFLIPVVYSKKKGIKSETQLLIPSLRTGRDRCISFEILVKSLLSGSEQGC